MTSPLATLAAAVKERPPGPAAAVAARPSAHQAPRVVPLVMCPPEYLSTKIPNNVFMEDPEPVDKPRAMRQYQRVKRLIEALGTPVYEIPPKKGAQDQTFTANIGVAIAPYIILANYKAAGRAIEVPPAKAFFESMGYRTAQPPFHFEGEADLKRLRDGLYIGGFGKFSDNRAFDWIEQLTGCQIIRVRETSDELYHLDCSLMPLDEENILASAEGLDRASLRALESVANVIPVPKGLAKAGITNGVKLTDKKIYLSGTLQPEEKAYRKAMEWLLDTLDRFGYVVTFLDTDSFNPSGADLSCMTMRLDFPPPRAAQRATQATTPA